MSEFIYVLENFSMPGIVKIGRTDRNVSERVNELSSHSGVPTEFVVVKEYPVADSIVAEHKIHEKLSEYRVSENREFFKLSAEDAVSMIENILGNQIETTFLRDVERKEELLAEAIQIIVKHGTVYPGLLAGLLKISYDESEFLIRSLKESGYIDSKNELSIGLRQQHELWQREERKRQKNEKIKTLERAQRHSRYIQQIKNLLGDLQDLETGEFVEIFFDRDKDDLIVTIRGSEWVKSEAQKRMAGAFPNGIPPTI